MTTREMKAFEILARENSRMLTVYLRSLVDDEAAVDDLFQETMVVAWRRLDECDLSLPFGPWLQLPLAIMSLHQPRRDAPQPRPKRQRQITFIQPPPRHDHRFLK